MMRIALATPTPIKESLTSPESEDEAVAVGEEEARHRSERLPRKEVLPKRNLASSEMTRQILEDGVLRVHTAKDV